MKPALFINDLQKGGAERLVTDLAFELAKDASISPAVIVGNPIGELQSAFHGDVPLYSLDVDISTTAIPGAIRALSTLVKEHDFDLVHSHLTFAHVVGRLACLRSSLPHVSTYHNVRGHKSVSKQLAERATEPLSDRIICVSEGVRQSFPNPDRMDVIYNAIDVEAFRSAVLDADSPVPTLKNDITVLLNVARCVEQKRQEDLIEAMARLDREDIHLFVIGEGPRRMYLEDLVDELDVTDCVTVTGYVDAVEPYYAIADVFVSTSSNEGLPTTHIEAMAVELPVLATDIPGVRELVTHGTHGRLFPAGDVDKLVDNLESVEDLTSRGFGENGYKTVKENFAIEAICNAHVDLYYDIIT